MSSESRRISPARRGLQLAVWVAFSGVLLLRWMRPDLWHAEEQSFPSQQGRSFQERRWQRPPTFIPTPVTPIPADLWRLQIQISDQGVQQLANYAWQGWRGDREQRPEALATVKEGDTIYTNVAIHLKGAAGSFRPFNDKPALTL